ncbi:MAG: hypothetical protein ABS882_12960 [Lysinibacillus sp.]
MIKIQYQGMSLLDEIQTVEITFDALKRQVHLYDPSAVVWPEYRGKDNGYVLSDGFILMTKVLGNKPLFNEIKKQNESEWLHNITWFFYKTNTPVLCLKENHIHVIKNCAMEDLNEQFMAKI